jgi:aminopeptidase N
VAVAIAASLVACASPPEITVRPVAPTEPSPAPTEAPDPSPSPTDPLPSPTDPDAPTTDRDADGVGDPFTPGAGNPGFDVQHYDLELTYDPDTAQLDGVVTVEALATDELDRFTLDLVGMDVERVEVDGTVAEFDRTRREIEITPAETVGDGTRFATTVTYGGVTEDKPDSPFGDISLGWIDTDVGAHVLNQPDGARQWFPGSDHPSDKATYSFRITVPEGYDVVTNGRATGTLPVDGDVEWSFENPEQMATYLVQVGIGDLDVVERAAGRLSHRSAVPAGTADEMEPYLTLADDVVRFFEPLFGPYPFDRYGLLVTDSASGLALETQTLPIFSSDDLPPLPEGGKPAQIAELLVAHELGHMWFGDAVTPARWEDLWLNEGPATYAQWLWLDEAGHLSLDTEAEFARSQMPDLRDEFGATDEPRPATLFSPTVYEGGAVVLHALRGELGDAAFFELLANWVADNNGESVTTDDFVDAASEAAGRDLSSFFETWLGEGDLPPYLT